MTIRTLNEVFIPGAEQLPERLRTLTVSPARSVEPGTTVEATFGFYNSGGATATGLRVRFALPEGLKYVAGSARVDGRPLTEEDGVADGAFTSPAGAVLGEIGPGIERRVTILYRVADLIEDGTTLTLQAALGANETTVVGSNVVRLTARSRPQLENAQTALTIEAPSGAEPGRELLIRARLTNLGQSSASDIVLGLPVPEHTRYSARSARVDGRPILDERGAPFEISASTVVAERLAPGESVVADYIAVIETPLDNGTPITATARVSAREVSEFEIFSNEITVSSMPSFDGEGTAFIIAGDDEVVPGMRLRMAVRAANVGTSSARRVTAQLTLPTGLAYSPGSATLDGLPLGDDLFEGMAYAFESVAPGRVAELAFDAVVVAPAPPDAKLPVAAKLTWESGERPFQRTLTIRSEPRFTQAKNIVERAGPPLAHPNEEVSFVVHVVNEGTAEATDALLRLRLDKALSFVSAQCGGRLLSVLDGIVTLGSLPPHLEQLITIVTRTISPIADRAEVTLGAELETRQLGAIDLGTASYTIRSRPRFSADETRLEMRTNEPLRPSRSVQVAVHLVNSGTDVARDVHVIFNHPPEIAISALGGVPFIDGELIFDAIPPGAAREALVDVRLAGFVPDGSSISLEARLESPTLSPLPLRPILLETRAEAEFAGEIELLTSPSDAVDAGAPLLHMLRFRNVGDGPAQSVVIRVRPSERVVYVPASTAVNEMSVEDEGGLSPLWALHGLILTDVDPGVPVTIRWETIVTSPIASGTLLTSSATMQWDEQSLTVASSEVVVRSSPEFASSPGGRSISIARLAARTGQEMLSEIDEPQTLPRPRPVAPVAPQAFTPAPTPSLVSAPAPAPVIEPPPPEPAAAAEEFDLPFFSAPPSENEEEEVESSFEYVEEAAFAEPHHAVRHEEPAEQVPEVNFTAPAVQFSEPEAIAPPSSVSPAAPAFGEPPSEAAQEAPREQTERAEQPAPQEQPEQQTQIEQPTPQAQPEQPTPHAQPEQPEQPTEHAQPEQPTPHAQPEQATEHAQPEQPTAQAQPEQPTAQAQPEQPTAQTQPEQPTPHAQPEQPTAQAQPEQPTAQAQPDLEREATSSAVIHAPPEAEPSAGTIPAAVFADFDEEVSEVSRLEEGVGEEPAIAAPIDEVARLREQHTVIGPLTFSAFAPDRLRRTLTFLQQSDYGKLVSHLFALEAFFPDSVVDEPGLDNLFVGVRDAFRSTLDRLFVRLRLPRYAIASRDLEDKSSRDAVIHLVDRVVELPVHEVSDALGPLNGGIRFKGPIDRAGLEHAVAGLGSAPIGGVTPWIACVALLGTTIETPAGGSDALGNYRATLISVLRVLEALPMSEFHRVLTTSTNAELDRALRDVINVLGGPVEVAGR